ncbi:MAG TPA: DUF1365 domain-containing protein [Limnobacter sp.]|nr:DUF1365 domain-containing protein [Limnobacter sp.]
MHATPFQLQDVKLAWGLVKHQRELPKPNGFRAGACFLKMRFERAASPSTLPVYPKVDKPGLVSVQAKHYGFEKHAQAFPDLIESLQARVSKETALELNGPVDLHTFPKVLGYVFNPVSFWYFHNQQGTCRAILCEVNNTFGERHFYLLTDPQQRTVPLDRGVLLHARKVFHVSPFFPVSGRYEFRFVNTGERTLARINYLEGNALQLSTSVSGELLHPSLGLWCKTLLKFGWLTVAVITKIHWQAVKLFIKGARFHSKPAPPNHSITHTEQEA